MRGRALGWNDGGGADNFGVVLEIVPMGEIGKEEKEEEGQEEKEKHGKDEEEEKEEEEELGKRKWR